MRISDWSSDVCSSDLLWATLAAIMFQPLYQWLLVRMRGGANRAAIASLLIITLSVLVPGFIIGGLIVEEAAGIVLAFQSGDIDISAWFAQIYGALPASARMALSQSGFGDFAELQARLQEFLSESAGLIAQQAVAIGGGVFTFALSLAVGLYVTYFLLRDGKRISTRVLHDLPLEPGIAMVLAAKFLDRKSVV